MAPCDHRIQSSLLSMMAFKAIMILTHHTWTHFLPTFLLICTPLPWYQLTCLLSPPCFWISLFSKCLGEGNGTSLQYSCLENPMNRGGWEAAVHGVAKSRTWLSDFTFTLMHWRRKWQPTQCSCLENPRDGGAWWAAIYGVAQSQTRLKWLSSSS